MKIARGLVVFSVICAILPSVPTSCAAVIGAAIAFLIAFRHKQFSLCYWSVGVVILGVAVTSYFYAVVVPVEQARSEREKFNAGKYNLRLLGERVKSYCKEHDGCLPDAGRWCDLLMEYDPNLCESNFKHPRIEYGACNFAFNKNLGGQRLEKIPSDVVLLFEADGDWNLAGTAELLKTADNNQKSTGYGSIRDVTRYVLLVDGTIETYWIENAGVRAPWRDDVYRPLRWTPDQQSAAR